jgi:hypothetical protein
MLPEQTIRSIAQRYVEPLKNLTAEERRFVIENALREVLIADQHLRQTNSIPPNAGCL